MISKPAISTLVATLFLAIVLPAATGAASAAGHDPAQVIVRQGQPVQIALATDLTGLAAGFGPSLQNAVRLAVIAHPSVRGFPIQVNVVDAPCGDPAADLVAASTITANTQTVGVLGQVCSSGFDQALALYQAAGIVTISGSATSDALPTYGPTVFDRTAVSDSDGFDAWYAQISTLPGDVAWQGAYAALLGAAPTQFADLYYDAAKVLIRNLAKTSRVEGANLVVDRAALARAVRHTTSVRGVTGTITIEPATGNRIVGPNARARSAH